MSASSFPLVCVFSLLSLPVFADLIPPGFKSVEHKLVFVESQMLQDHRLVAAPVRGFKGVAEIQAGIPFRFSSKYRTRFYLVPKDMDLPSDFDQEQFANWPSVEPPCTEVSVAPLISTVASALTTLRLAGIASDGSLQIEIVKHQIFDSFGNRAGMVNFALRTLGLVTCGLLIIGGLYHIRRSRRLRGSQETSGTAT